MHEVAFATYEAEPGLGADERLVAAELAVRGVAVVPAVWSDPAVRWRRFGAVVLRTTWDYHLHPAAYTTWLRRLAADGVPVWNPLPVVLGNLDKRYLLALAERGVAIVPSELVPQGRAGSLAARLAARGWAEAVVKPTVSAGAVGTWRTSTAEAAAHQLRFTAAAAEGDLLLQPFLPEIVVSGEWSLVFLDRLFSHAARKLPRPGDFRVQTEHGGVWTPSVPPPALLAAAESALAQVEGPLLYARIDLVEHLGEWRLMELEIHEPYLFLEHDPAAPARFAEALLRLEPSLRT